MKLGKKITFIVAIDMLCYASFGSILPIIFSEKAGFFKFESYSTYFIFGSMIASYSIFQAISVPFWGKLAERSSPSLVLSFSYIGNLIGYLFCLASTLTHSLSYMYIGFAVAGLTGANMSMIYAIVSSQNKSKDLSQAYSLLGALTGVCFIVGPQISNYLLKVQTARDSMIFILMVSCLIACINSFIAHSISNKKDLKFANHSFKKNNTIKNSKICIQTKLTLLSIFVVYFAWYFFIKFFPIILLDLSDFNISDTCHITSFLGGCCVFIQIFRTGFSSVYFNNKFCTIFALICMSVCFFSINLIENIQIAFFIVGLVGMSYGLLAPNLISNVVLQSSQRAYSATLCQTMQSLAKVLAPILSGYTLSQNMIFPSFFIGFSLIIILLLNTFYNQNIIDKIRYGDKRRYSNKAHSSPLGLKKIYTRSSVLKS